MSKHYIELIYTHNTQSLYYVQGLEISSGLDRCRPNAQSEKGKNEEPLPTNSLRQADRTNSEVVYHRVHANHEAQ